MQIRLTNENEKLLGTFRELCRLVIPSYNEKEGSIVNSMLKEALTREIERHKRKKP